VEYAQEAIKIRANMVFGGGLKYGAKIQSKDENQPLKNEPANHRSA
jgi:hypothetical protein